MSHNDISFDKAIIFPYSKEFASTVRALFHMNKLGKSTRIIAPIGWGTGGMDAGEAYGYPRIGLFIKNSAIEEMNECDSLIITPYDFSDYDPTNEDIEILIDSYINNANSFNIKVFDLRDLRGMTLEKINDIYLLCEGQKIIVESPIVYVSGLVEQVDKLAIQFDVGNELTRRGYKVLHVGSKQYCSVINMNNFPDFMFAPITESKKIEYFKSYLFDLYMKEKPDILFVGIPGASMKFNQEISNGYGIINYLVSMAATPDFSIVCTDCREYEKVETEFLYKYRYGYEVDCFVMSNTKIMYDPIVDENRLTFETIDYSEVDEVLTKQKNSNQNIPQFRIYNYEHVCKIADLIINRLGDMDFYTI